MRSALASEVAVAAEDRRFWPFGLDFIVSDCEHVFRSFKDSLLVRKPDVFPSFLRAEALSAKAANWPTDTQTP